MNSELISAALVFAAAFCSMLLVCKVKGGTVNKRDQAMRIALDRVRGISPPKTSRAVPVNEYGRQMKRHA